MSGFIKEFREFAIKGNMIDLAVGVIIGTAFSKIIDSLVADIIMPIANFILGGQVDFTNQFIVLRMPEGYAGPDTYADLTAAGAILFAWGNFLTIFINFLLLALVVFMIVKAMNTARRRFEREQEAAPPAPPAEEVVLLREIRDALKQREGVN